MLSLDREQHDGIAVAVGLPRDLSRVASGAHGQRHRLAGRLEHEPGFEGAPVLAARNEGDVEALLEEPAPDRPSDGTGTHDHEAHGLHSAMRTACQALLVASLNLNPVERATAFGGAVAGAPLRLVGGLAGPARGDMARTVRRAIGISERPAPIATDPDEAYLPPGGMARTGARRPGDDAHRRSERAAPPDTAPPGHGRGG